MTLSRRPRAALIVLLAAVLVLVLPSDRLAPGTRRSAEPAVPEAEPAPLTVPSGFFTGSDATGVRRIGEVQRWLGGGSLTVGHTYLPGDRWSNIEGHPALFEPWARWKEAGPGRLFVLNVPLLDRSEDGLPDD
ncbi:hypothetical protein ACWDX6_02405 [Streptomyces sp. NPDC003027]